MQINRQSADWLAVKEFCETELDRLRTENDNETLDSIATAALRGQIKFAKAVLALADRPALVEVEQTEYLT